MRRTTQLIPAVLLSSVGLVAQEPSLQVGDPAPALDVAHWIKGEAVTGFEPGQAYVVEFWATWCPPCKESMPHLSELQKEFGDKVVIIGLSDESLAVAKAFLDKPEWASKTDYTLGTDPDRSAYRDYMDASGQMGIPTTFLIDGEGKVGWIGHPDAMDRPLEENSGDQAMAKLRNQEFVSTPEAQAWIDKAAAALLEEPLAWDYELSASVLIGMSAKDLLEAKLKKKGAMVRAGEAGMRQTSQTFFEMPGMPPAKENDTTLVLHEGMYYVDQETSSPLMAPIDGRISVKNANGMRAKFAGPYPAPLQGLMFDPNPISADPGRAFPEVMKYCSLDVAEITETEVLLFGEGSALLDMNLMMEGLSIDTVPVHLRLERASGRLLELVILKEKDIPSFRITVQGYRAVDLTDPAAIHGGFPSREWGDLATSIRKQMQQMAGPEAR